MFFVFDLGDEKWTCEEIEAAKEAERDEARAKTIRFLHTLYFK